MEILFGGVTGFAGFIKFRSQNIEHRLFKIQPPMKMFKCLFFLFSLHATCLSSFGQGSRALLFREDWKETPAALPVTQAHVANPDLILGLYGPGRDAIKKSNHPQIPNDPYYIWSGECKGNWAVTLRRKSKAIDLSGDAMIAIRSKQSGFRQLRLLLKLAAGDWLVSDEAMSATDDWTEKEFHMASIRWRKLNIDTITEGAWADNPDLSKVTEIGFTDLMAGGGTPASSRVDWIAVYGKTTSR